MNEKKRNLTGEDDQARSPYTPSRYQSIRKSGEKEFYELQVQNFDIEHIFKDKEKK